MKEQVMHKQNNDGGLTVPHFESYVLVILVVSILCLGKSAFPPSPCYSIVIVLRQFLSFSTYTLL